MMTRTVPIESRDIKKAIELRINRCFPAMNIANAIGGSPSIPWELAREHGFIELLEEAIERGIDVTALCGNVDDTPIRQSPIFQNTQRQFTDPIKAAFGI